MIFDFKCSNGHTKEHWVSSSIREVRCEECENVATRCVSAATVKLDPLSGDFPGATMKWAKQHEKMAKRSSD